MRTPITLALLLVFLGVAAFGQALASGPPMLESVLGTKVRNFQVKDAGFLDGLSELSSNSIAGLHLGIEELPRERLSDPRDVRVRFSLNLNNKTVREILDNLCQSDTRYIWSTDGSSINVYPRATAHDQSILLNLSVDKITLTDVPDPDQALTPLAARFPQKQVGYIQMGGENAYEKPWTITFEHLTVRQFIDRIAEHIGSQSSWIWQGGKDSMMFTFLKGGFHTY